MGLLKLINNRISSEWKDIFNKNVDYMNDLETKLTDTTKVTNNRIDNLVLSSGGDSSNEVVDARVNNKGDKFNTLQNRLTTHENLSDEQINNIITKYNEQKLQLEKLNTIINQYLGGDNDNIDIYVSKDGNDVSGDGTEEKPFLTIQAAINALPIVTTRTVYIWVGDGVYLEDINITGYRFESFIIRAKNDISSIDISKSDLPVKIRSLSIMSCSGYVRLEGLQIVDTANSPNYEGRKYGVLIDQSGYLTLSKCKFSERTTTFEYNAVYVGGTSKLNMYSDTRFDNQDIALHVRLLSEAVISPIGSGNTTGVRVENATVRGNPTSSFATTPIQMSGNGLAITKGTVL